jgi:hypothetical protein
LTFIENYRTLLRMPRIRTPFQIPHYTTQMEDLWDSLPIDGSQGSSSVSIVSSYGLGDRTIEVRSPAEARDFSSNFCVQTGSAAHPASRPMVTGISPRKKRGRGVRLTTHPHLVPRS